jgi:ribosome assembly protein 4
LIWTLEGHGHWVNHIALSTDFALKTGPFGHDGRRPSNEEEALKVAKERYEKHKGCSTEHLVSCSDDFSIFLWDPTITKKPITRLTGHQQLVNHVCFSPDGRFLASASFDKSVKIWNGKTGKFMVTLRGHVGPVYRVVFSADSRLLMSASKDSTCKIWNLRTQKLMEDLPGHADEVFAVDWSPTGKSGASGGKDKMLRM